MQSLSTMSDQNPETIAAIIRLSDNFIDATNLCVVAGTQYEKIQDQPDWRDTVDAVAEQLELQPSAIVQKTDTCFYIHPELLDPLKKLLPYTPKLRFTDLMFGLIKQYQNLVSAGYEPDHSFNVIAAHIAKVNLAESKQYLRVFWDDGRVKVSVDISRHQDDTLVDYTVENSRLVLQDIEQNFPHFDRATNTVALNHLSELDDFIVGWGPLRRKVYYPTSPPMSTACNALRAKPIRIPS